MIVTAARGRAGVAAVRDVGRGGFVAIGADHGRPPFGLRSRWSAAHLILPQPTDSAALLDALERSGAQAVLPMDSRLAGFCARHRERLRRKLGLAVPDEVGFLGAYDNLRTIEACGRLGVPAPRLLQPGAREELIVVKPRADVGAAKGVAFCRGPGEVERALLACRPFGEPVMQEYIPGGVEAMRTAVVLLDRRSRLVAWFTTRKLHQFPATGGMTTMSVSTDERARDELAMPLFEAWRWEGPAEVELKVDPRDGQAKVIEVNPRLPSYLPFAVRCGLHLPRLQALVALGESPRAGTYAVGRTYVNPTLHLKARLAGRHRLGDRLRGLGQAVAEMRGAFLGDGLDLLDPAPRVAKLIAEWRGGLRRRAPFDVVPLDPAPEAGSSGP